MRWFFIFFVFVSTCLEAAPQRISSVSHTLSGASNPEVAMNSTGTSVIAWQQFQQRANGSFLNLFASINQSTSLITITTDPFNALIGNVAIDGIGTAYVVYTQQPSKNAVNQVFLATFSTTQPVNIQQISFADSTHFISSNPVVAVNSAGKVVIAYVQDTKVSTGVKGVVYAYVIPNIPGASVFTTALSTPITNPFSEQIFPAVAINTFGAAIVAWNQPTTELSSTMDMIFVNTLTAANQWRGHQQITQAIRNVKLAATDPEVAIADDESAIVSYLQNTVFSKSVGTFNMAYITFLASGTVKSTSMISAGDLTHQNVNIADIAMSSNGWAILTYQQTTLESIRQTPNAINQAYASTKSPTGTFSTPLQLSSTLTPVIPSTSQLTSIDTVGRANVIWLQNTGTPSIATVFLYQWGKSAAPLRGPLSVSQTGSSNVQSALFPIVAMDNNNNTLIVWNQAVRIGSFGFVPSIFYSYNP